MTGDGASPDGNEPGSVEGSGIEVAAVHKWFGSTHAVNNVSFRVQRGEIHGLVGENGSGKSTLVNIAMGVHIPDEGVIRISGFTPQHGATRGRVGAVFQDGTLVQELSVLDNLRLIGQRRGVPDDYARKVVRDLSSYGIDIGPDAKVGDLPVSTRRMIEIIAICSLQLDALFFDEATSVLDVHQVAQFQDITREMARRGTAIVVVSHRLGEVFASCSRITVLRDGRAVWAGDTNTTDEERLVTSMSGREVASFSRTKGKGPGNSTSLLSAGGIRLADDVSEIGLDLHRGEVVGVGGPAGNGQEQLLRSLAGMPRHGSASYRLTVSGHHVRSLTDAVQHGIFFVSSDRKAESLFHGLSIRENFGIYAVSTRVGRWWIRRKTEIERVRREVQEHGIVAGTVEQPAESLSGGNQQKLALARALVHAPQVLIIEGPSEGVDVRSRRDIYRRLERAAEGGCGVIFSSTDASELASLCDRVLVISNHRLVSVLEGDKLSEDEIVRSFATAAIKERRNDVGKDAGHI